MVIIKRKMVGKLAFVLHFHLFVQTAGIYYNSFSSKILCLCAVHISVWGRGEVLHFYCALKFSFMGKERKKEPALKNKTKQCSMELFPPREAGVITLCSRTVYIRILYCWFPGVLGSSCNNLTPNDGQYSVTSVVTEV